MWGNHIVSKLRHIYDAMFIREHDAHFIAYISILHVWGEPN